MFVLVYDSWVKHTYDVSEETLCYSMKGRWGFEPLLICVRQKFLLDPHALPTELLSWRIFQDSMLHDNFLRIGISLMMYERILDNSFHDR